MKFKNKFWYESNACWGFVETLDDLYKKYKLQTDHQMRACKNVYEFLDKSKQHRDGTLNFGTRIEHKGDKTLKEYLHQNKILNKFLKLVSKNIDVIKINRDLQISILILYLSKLYSNTKYELQYSYFNRLIVGLEYEEKFQKDFKNSGKELLIYLNLPQVDTLNDINNVFFRII